MAAKKKAQNVRRKPMDRARADLAAPRGELITLDHVASRRVAIRDQLAALERRLGAEAAGLVADFHQMQGRLLQTAQGLRTMDAQAPAEA